MKTLREAERALRVRLMAEAVRDQGSVGKAARALGMDRAYFYKVWKKLHGLTPTATKRIG